MISLTGLNYFSGHVLQLIYYLPVHEITPAWYCYVYIADVILYVSMITPLFLYISFNKTFRSFFVKMIMCRRAIVNDEMPLSDLSTARTQIRI